VTTAPAVAGAEPAVTTDEDAQDAVDAAGGPRSTIPRFTIPTLTIPTLTLPKWGRGKDESDAVAAVEGDVAETESEPNTDAEADAETEPDSEADTETETETAPAADGDAESEPGSATDTDAETAPATEAATEPEPEPEPDAGALARVVVAAAETSAETSTDVLVASGLRKLFDDTVAVEALDLVVPRGSFYGIVGPNGAGKTTTLSMITGLLRPDSGTVVVNGADVWTDPIAAKRTIGVLPDRLRLFDRLTGAQLLHYSGMLRGLPTAEVTRRTADLARVFGLEDALDRLVSDYSAGMTKQIALAAAMIHSPRLLVLDEPFESVDPVSAERVIGILRAYVAEGGTVLLSSHSMELVERICDRVAVIVGGAVLADGTIDEVRDGRTLEERFVELAGAGSAEGLEWLHAFSD